MEIIPSLHLVIFFTVIDVVLIQCGCFSGVDVLVIMVTNEVQVENALFGDLGAVQGMCQLLVFLKDYVYLMARLL